MSRFAPTGPISLGDIWNARQTGVPDAYSFGQLQSNTGFGNTGSVMDSMSRSQHIPPAGAGHINVTAPMCLDNKIYAGGRATRTGTNDLNSFRGKGAIYGVRNMVKYNTNYPYGITFTTGTGATEYGNATNLWSDSNWTSTCHCVLGRLQSSAVAGYLYGSHLWYIWNTAANTDASSLAWKNSLPSPRDMADWNGIVSVNSPFEGTGFVTKRSLSYQGGTFDNNSGATTNGGFDYIDMTSRFGFHGTNTGGNPAANAYRGNFGGSGAPLTDTDGSITGIVNQKWWTMDARFGTSTDPLDNGYGNGSYTHIFFLG